MTTQLESKMFGFGKKCFQLEQNLSEVTQIETDKLHEELVKLYQYNEYITRN